MTEAFFDYLRYELNRSPLTVLAYKTDIGQFREWLSVTRGEDVDFKDVSSHDVRAWLASLSREGMNPRSLRRKIISLRTLYKWMKKTGMISHSPLQDVVLPKISKPLPDIIKGDEIEDALQRLSQTEEDELTRALHVLVIEMLYSLGIRRRELVGLNDEDVSSDKGEIKVTGKRAKQRVIPVPVRLIDIIKKWQTIRDRIEEKPEGETPLLIVKGKRITDSQVYQIVKKALSGSSARKKSPHALRHSFASGMLNGGAELDSVREFLGHSSLATTQIYTHISLAEIKKAYSKAHPRSNDSKN